MGFFKRSITRCYVPTNSTANLRRQPAAAGMIAPIRRAGLWVDMTDACVALDDPDRTCAYAMTGLDEADRHARHLPILQISRARTAFPRSWWTLAPVVELDERLAVSN